jgi:hypothetical protein
MPIQWRACGRWALLGVVSKGHHEAFLVFDPLVTRADAMSLLQHVVPAILADSNLWQHSEPTRSGFFG